MKRPTLILAPAVWLAWATLAHAQTPSITLSEVASARLQTISFFLVVLTACALVIRWVWNSLRSDFPALPRLSFGKSLGLVALWGLLFLLMLTMISGARELLTPGAWKKQGLTYNLAESEPPAAETPPGLPRETERRAAIERLRGALWSFALANAGRFPTASEAESAMSKEVWRLPDPSGMKYTYVPGHRPGEPDAVVAYEPGLFGPDRLTLTAEGQTRVMTADALSQALKLTKQGAQ
ncbi:MAG: hypothetical protein U0835_13530 [Isosphaeraceae bacterium]